MSFTALQRSTFLCWSFLIASIHSLTICSAQSTASQWKALVESRSESIDFQDFARAHPSWLADNVKPDLKTSVPALDGLETALLPWGQDPNATDVCMQILFENNYRCAQIVGVMHGRYGPFLEQKLETAALPISFQWIAATTSAFDPAFDADGRAGIWGMTEELGQESGLFDVNGIDQRKLVEESTAAFVMELSRLHRRFPNDPHRVLVAFWKGMAYATRWSGEPGYDVKLDERITLLKVLSRFMVNIERPSFELDWINQAQEWKPLECDDGQISRNNLLTEGGFRDSDLRSLLPWWNSENLSCEIAQKYGVRIPNVFNLNGSEQSKIDIAISQEKPLPSEGSKTIPKASIARAEEVGFTDGVRCIMHEVKKGDTLWNIAQRYPSTSPEELAELNQINDYIRIGQVLCVPDKR